MSNITSPPDRPLWNIRPLPRLQLALGRRYPQLRVITCEGFFYGNSLESQTVCLQGSPEQLIATGLVTEETFDWAARARDGRRRGPVTEMGVDIKLYGAPDSEETILSLHNDYPDGPLIRSGVFAVESQKLQRQVVGLLKKVFALPQRREVSP
jgi:hypothetical protein